MGKLSNISYTFQTKQEEVNIFTMHSLLSCINSHLDSIKKFLKIIISPVKLDDFGKDTTLGKIVGDLKKQVQSLYGKSDKVF